MSGFHSFFSVFQDSRSRGPYLYICLVSLLFGHDASMFGVALPSISRELGGSAPALVPYIYAGALLSLAGFVVPAGRACDLYGPKKCGMIGAIVVLLGYALVICSPNLQSVIAGRVLTGFGLALLWPVTLTLASASVSDEAQRKQGFNLIHIVQVLSTVVGALMGGFLATQFGWRMTPFFGLSLAVAAIVLTPYLLSGVPELERKSVSLNLGAATVLTLGVTCLLWTLSSTIRAGGFAPQSMITAVLSIVFLVGFYLLNKHSRAPILPAALFRYRNVVGASVAVALATAVTGSTFLVSVVYLQKVANYSAQTASMMIFPRGFAALVGGALAGYLMSRVSGRGTAMVGVGIMLVSSLLLLQLSADWALYILPLVILGMATGDMLTNPGLLSEAMVDLPQDMRGIGSALFMILIVFGGAVITTIVLVVLESGGASGEITPQSLATTKILIATMPVLALLANIFLVKPLAKAGMATAH